MSERTPICDCLLPPACAHFWHAIALSTSIRPGKGTSPCVGWSKVKPNGTNTLDLCNECVPQPATASFISSHFFSPIRSLLPFCRLILQSFQLSSKLLARSEQVRLDEKCVRQLAGSLHCGTCLQSSLDPGTRPCRSTCRSVVSSCMASSELVHISQAWKELTQSLGKLVDSVVAQRNPETIFAAYPNLLNGALELARSKNEIFKKVCRISSLVLIMIHQLVRRPTASLPRAICS